MFRFTLRDMLWAIAVVSLLVVVWVRGAELNALRLRIADYDHAYGKPVMDETVRAWKWGLKHKQTGS